MRQLEGALHLLAEQDPSVDPDELVTRIEWSLSAEGVPVVALQRGRIMQTREKPLDTTRRGVPRRAWVVAAALAAITMAIGVAVLLFGGGEPGDVVSAPVAVFDLQTDSLCDWFTAEDLNEIFTAAQQRAGTAYDLEEFIPGGCSSDTWRTTTRTSSASGGLSGYVHVSALHEWVEGNPGAPFVDPDTLVEHHLLDDRVSYRNRTLQFGWMEGLDGYLKVDGHEDEILYFGIAFDDHDGVTHLSGEYEELGLVVVNELLRRMNWTDTGE